MNRRKWSNSHAYLPVQSLVVGLLGWGIALCFAAVNTFPVISDYLAAQSPRQLTGTLAPGTGDPTNSSLGIWLEDSPTEYIMEFDQFSPDAFGSLSPWISMEMTPRFGVPITLWVGPANQVLAFQIDQTMSTSAAYRGDPGPLLLAMAWLLLTAVIPVFFFLFGKRRSLLSNAVNTNSIKTILSRNRWEPQEPPPSPQEERSRKSILPPDRSAIEGGLLIGLLNGGLLLLLIILCFFILPSMFGPLTRGSICYGYAPGSRFVILFLSNFQLGKVLVWAGVIATTLIGMAGIIQKPPIRILAILNLLGGILLLPAFGFAVALSFKLTC